MRELDKIAETLFEKIRSRFENVSIGDENAKSTQDPESARFFNFEYVSKDGTNFGNVTISLIDETSLKVYFSKNISDDLGEEHQEEWYSFLRGLRKFAKRNLLSFDTRDIARSNLQIKDLKQQSKADSTYSSNELAISESKLYGTSRSSYQECGPTKIIVRHSANVDEEKRGARSRNIDAVFIETHEGERFKLPFKNLHGARALARHLAEGGLVMDELGQDIIGQVKEMNDMAHFVRSTKNRQFEDQETQSMAQAAVNRYTQLRKSLRHLATGRGYTHYKETYVPVNDIEEDVDVDSLRERFVKKIYDDRFNEALPYVYRAYKQQQEQLNTSMGEEFESWANEVTEGTWSVPDTQEKINDLSKVMEKPLAVGVDGDTATNALYDIIGDDQLFDQISAVADEEGPEADARPLVLDWLNANDPELAAQFQTALVPPAQPEQPAVPNQTVASTTNEPSPPAVDESLDFLRQLAGLKR